ncbi:MAG: hypothetical protein NWE99_08060 [Candidatus Bathyarchaeota archaeon]|nr:hypothetical protein [Candidatus Bathyarchaeota archaeon]
MGKKLSSARIMVTNTRGKLKIIAFGTVLILLFTSIILFLHSSQVSRRKAVLTVGTFAFYYPWYGTPSVSGYWHHWNDASHNPDNFADERRDIPATDHPLLDVYDSNNETVIEQHIQWAKQAGIGCFIISWWGINDFTDNVSRHIVKMCERDNFNFTFYYELTGSVSQTVNELAYLCNTYGKSSSFLKVDGRPVIFIYSRARDDLNPNEWIWHACTDSIGIDQSPNTNESASTCWMLSEDVRKPPRLGIISFQPFVNEPAYVQSANPIRLRPNEQYLLNVGVSCVRNDSVIRSDVGIKIKLGLDNSCNVTLNPNVSDQIVSFDDGWQDWKFDITSFAGHDVYIRAESYNGGSVNWSSEWAAIDYFYITDSSGKIVSSDPFLDNHWKEVRASILASGANPYVIMDFGGYEGKVQDFMKYFSDSIDGIHVYNPVGILKENHSKLSNLYHDASKLAHDYNKPFIATIVPGFNNAVASNYSPESLKSIVDRQSGSTYRRFWQIAKDSSPDGYAITSFNEWHEGTEIEPSMEYSYQYLNLTRENQPTTIPECQSIILPLYVIVTVFVIATILIVIVHRRQCSRMVRKRKNKLKELFRDFT